MAHGTPPLAEVDIDGKVRGSKGEGEMKSKPRRKRALRDGACPPMAKLVFCPSCNRPYLTDGLKLPPVKRRIVQLIERHGEVMAEVIHAAIWGSDPNGGPPMKTLYVHIHQLNRILAKYGLAVRSNGGRGGCEPFRLVAEAAE